MEVKSVPWQGLKGNYKAFKFCNVFKELQSGHFYFVILLQSQFEQNVEKYGTSCRNWPETAWLFDGNIVAEMSWYLKKIEPKD